MIKEYLKEAITWLLSLFNVGIFMDDSVDSLITRLKILNLNQAEEIVRIYQELLLVEYLKGIFMCMSVLVLCLVHQSIILASWHWIKETSKTIFKKLIKYFKNIKK